jgi:hypothetical protein
MNRKLVCWALALSLPLLGACAKEGAETEDAEDVQTTTSEQELPGTTQPGDVSPPVAEMAIDDVKLGSQLDANGTIDAEHGGDDFTPGQPVYVAMNVGDVPAGSTVKVAWYSANETKVGEETKTVAEGVATLNFQATDTSSWAKGDYRVEVWYGDEKVAEEQFQIVDAENAGT